MKRMIFFLTLLYSVTTQAVLTLPDKAEIGHSVNYALNGGVERGLATFARYTDAFTVTISNASPAVLTTTGTTPQIGDGIVLSTTGALPTGLSTNTVYYVVALPSATTFNVATTRGGSAIATTSAGSGTHTAQPTRPYKGLGGTPTRIAISSSNSSPIQGARSLVVTNSGSTAAAGEGFSLQLAPIDPVDRGVMLNVNFSYIVQSGTFQVGNTTTTPLTDSDLEVFLWDQTAGQAIPITPTLLQCGAVGSKCDFVGQTVVPPTSTSFRLLFHSATANTLAYSVKFDAFNVSRAVRTFGVSSFETQTYTMVPGSTGGTAPTKGTVAVDLASYRRVGEYLELTYSYTQTAAGSAGAAGAYTFPLPPGLSADLNKVKLPTVLPTASSMAYGGTEVGHGIATTTSAGNGAFNGPGTVYLYDAKSVAMNSNNSTTANAGYPFGTGAQANYAAATLHVSFQARIPIAGWSNGSSMSDQSPSVPVYFSVYRSAALNYPTSIATTVYDTVTSDTHAGYSTTTGAYTVKVPGLYHCDQRTGIATNQTQFAINSYVYLDGVSVCTDYKFSSTYSGSHNVCGRDFFANAGQLITGRNFAGGSGLAMLTGIDMNYLNCHKVNQGLGITAADPLSASYYLSANTSVAAQGVIKYDTKIDDPLNAYNPTTGVFTCLIGGKFRATATGSTNTTGAQYAVLNGATKLGTVAAPQASSPPSSGGLAFRCTTGQTVTINNESAATLSGPVTLYGPVNFFTIERTGP